MRETLSDRRGNRAGIAFFRIFLRWFGTRHACNMVWFVAFFYALCDREARRRARSYLVRRFPGDRGLRMFLHIWRLLASQGEALVLAAAYGAGLDGGIPRRQEGKLSPGALDPGHGVVLVISHFGCWQASLAELAGYERPVTLLAASDVNPGAVGKQEALHNRKTAFREIDVRGFMGGLPEALEAVLAGDVLGVMGDRPGTAGTGEVLECSFLGQPAKFPITPFYVAARAGVTVVPVFMVWERRPFQVRVIFGDEILPEAIPDGRIRAERLRPAVEQYVRWLETMAGRYPYLCFRFE